MQEKNFYLSKGHCSKRSLVTDSSVSSKRTLLPDFSVIKVICHTRNMLKCVRNLYQRVRQCLKCVNKIAQFDTETLGLYADD